MSSNFGTLFRISTFGESHCKGVGVVIDGCPPGMRLDEQDIQPQLDRRRPGQSSLTTDRSEADLVSIISGTENGRTLGTPILLQVANKDQRPADYDSMQDIPRPSHADYTYQQKYGIRASSGGGRSSARETIGTVAAGAVALKILREKFGLEIVAWVSSVGDIDAAGIDQETLTRQDVDTNEIRCPDGKAAQQMTQLVAALKEEGDSVGGVVSCVIRNVPRESANRPMRNSRRNWPRPCWPYRQPRALKSARASPVHASEARGTTIFLPSKTAGSAHSPIIPVGSRAG